MPRTAAALSGADALPLRDHLIRVAEGLIAQRRTEGLTVRAIARKAQVADGVLYNHFEGKEDLLAQALLAHVDHADHELPEPPPPGEQTLRDNLAAQVRHLFELHRRILPAFAGLLGQPAVVARFHAMTPEQKGPGLRGRMAVHLRAEQELGRLEPEVDVEAAAALVVGACYEAVLGHLFRQDEGELPAVSEAHVVALVDTLLSGLAPR